MDKENSKKQPGRPPADRRRKGMRIKGSWGGFRFEAKVYDSSVKHGVNGGRVGKLGIREGRGADAGQEIASYDRVWIKKPGTDSHRHVFENIAGELEALPPFEV